MYRMILFDVDGVLLSEERCFDASALSVWELLHHPEYLGLPGDSFRPDPDENTLRRIRREVFDDDRVLDWMKGRGINSNWDMVFLTFSFQLLSLLHRLQEKHPGWADWLREPIDAGRLRELGRALRGAGINLRLAYNAFVPAFSPSGAKKHELLLYLNRIAGDWLGIQTSVFSRNSALWELGRSVYQEWYLGEKWYREIEGADPETRGKPGFLHQEIPLAAPEAIRETMDRLRDRGITLGIGTGRPRPETEVPLQALGLWDAFEPERIVTASDVVRAEEAHPDCAPLGKPHPFTYVKGYLGRGTADEACIDAELPLPEGDRVLIVGDSVADLLAARRMGCRFAATLTGLTGKKARATFEELGADYIVEDVTRLPEAIF
ncbi:MAG: HAD family hydrolase [Planifilum sp.]|jgi:phosphoglycolate phosphatase-like HAD superfamily hydrolase